MHNAVVLTVSQALAECGISSLRFNFRGVGRSDGSHDEGRGEQDDILEAHAWLQERVSGTVLLIGYSFGAWVCAMAMRSIPRPAEAILIAPPLDLFTFPIAAIKGRLRLIVAAGNDAFCSASHLKTFVSALACPLVSAPETDHFFSGSQAKLHRILADALTANP